MATRRGPDNSLRVAINGTCLGVNWANIFHAQLTTGSSIIQADLDSWVTSFAADYKTRFAGFQAANVAYVQAKAVLYTPGLTELISTQSMTGNGTNAAGQIGNNATASIVSWNTSVYWRGGKPRTYLQGTSATMATNGIDLTAATITALRSAAQSFRTDINALAPGTITGTSFGFLSFSSGNVPRVPAVFFPITGATVHGRLGTQRRRLGKWTN